MKTLHKFLEQGEPAKETEKEDPKVKQAQAKENMLKKRVLMTKIRAVRGGATGIMASHEPEGDQLDERNKSDDAFIEGETGSKTSRRNLTRAMSSTTASMGKGAKGKAEDSMKRRERHQADRGVKTRGTKAGHSGSAYPKKEKTLDDTYPHKKTARLQRKLADRKAGRKHVDDTHHSLKKKTVGEKLPKVKVDEACWKGYKAYGMKKKGGKMVPNCKPVGSVKEGMINSIKKRVRIAKRVAKDATSPYDSGSSSIGSLGNPHLGNEEKRSKERAAKRGVKKEEVGNLQEYSPNVTYQAKGGRKSGKLGKSSVYSLKDKGESKKEFRKSQIKDIKCGYLKTE